MLGAEEVGVDVFWWKDAAYAETCAPSLAAGNEIGAGNRRPGPWLATLLVMAMVAVAAPGCALADERTVITPDAELQSAISDFATAATETGRSQALARIPASKDQSYDEIVCQLLYYSAHTGNTRQAMAPGAVFRELNIPDGAVVQSLVPLLDTTDAEVAKSVRSILGGLEGRSAGRRPDFSIYRESIASPLRESKEPPPGLIRYLYESDPGQAMLMLMRAHQLREPERIKPILWAEHVVADVLWKQQYGFLKPSETSPAAQTELAALANRPEWWARLYVAEIMRQHAAFHRPELMDRLAHDSHALVREPAVTIEGERRIPSAPR